MIAPDPPLIGPGTVATGAAQDRIRGTAVDFRLLWRSPSGREWNAERIVERAVAYLEGQGVWDHWEPDALVSEAGTQPTITRGAKFIVSLDPTVVIGLATQSIRPYQETSDLWILSFDPADEGSRDGAAYVALPHYFFSGTRIPWSQDLQWFSPDLGVGPQPLSEIQTGANEYRIPVRWGTIVLRIEGEELVASGIASAE